MSYAVTVMVLAHPHGSPWTRPASHASKASRRRGFSPAVMPGSGVSSSRADSSSSTCQRWERALKCTKRRFRRRVVRMTEMTVSDARARLADVVDAARVAHSPVYLTRRGHRVAAVIDADDLDRLIAAAEDLADLETAAAARAEIADGQATIPWELVKADLGLA